LYLRADPLHELPHREHHAAVLVQECGCPGKIQRVLLDRQRPFEDADQLVGQFYRGGATTRANWVEQIQHLFLANWRGHGNARRVNVRNTCAQCLRPRDHAGNAETDVIGTLVTHHLRRHSGHDRAFRHGRAIVANKLFGKRVQETRRGRSEADADDVHVHARALNGWVIRHGQNLSQ